MCPKNQNQKTKQKQQVKQFTKGTQVETNTRHYFSYCQKNNKKTKMTVKRKDNKSNNSQKELTSKLLPNSTCLIVMKKKHTGFQKKQGVKQFTKGP